ncbi:sugar-binding transcriptional regulator [Bombilactobacillus bombi]|uniref:sugar-binding transcriptional regulator n=1 Tax=Bombilactobacillus bombi TaxID=1303590 RepID=UPI000E574AA4|nr:sugar-binding domain-containing protein [Bombilactobacillus bombi]AXX65114.1 sugar-binding transcriptional regulator [Bombilactobacillus bombi]
MTNLNYRQQLADIARDYYLSQATITEISEKYHLSRYLITKSLSEAIDNGIVQILIQDPINRNLELEARFKKLFTIKNVYIIKDADSFNDNSDNIIAFAAQIIQELISDSKIVAVTWGQTVLNIINHFQVQAQENLLFIPLTGANLKTDSPAGSTPVVQRAAAKFGAHYQTLPAPLYIMNDQVRQQLAEEAAIAPVFEKMNQADLLFTGLGTWASIESIPLWQQQKKQILAGLQSQQVAGLLYGRPFDCDGNILNTKHDKLFGASLNTILQIPIRIGIVKSKFKSAALLGALRGCLLTDVIMTESVAQRVLLDNKVK